MRKRIPLAVLATGFLWLAACTSSSVQWSPTQPSPRPMAKRAVWSVEVYQDEAPPRPHIEVGVLFAETARSTGNDVRAKLTGHVRKKAATLGCDAILVRDMSQPEVPGSKEQPPIWLQVGCLMWTADQAQLTGSAPAPAPVAAPSAGPGCTNEIDCRGDRICENGQCVSSRSPIAATQPTTSASPALAKPGTGGAEPLPITGTAKTCFPRKPEVLCVAVQYSESEMGRMYDARAPNRYGGTGNFTDYGAQRIDRDCARICRTYGARSKPGELITTYGATGGPNISCACFKN